MTRPGGYLAVEVAAGAWSGYRAYLGDGERLIVGRSMKADLPVRDAGLAPYHFSVESLDGGAVVRAVDPGDPIEKEGPLESPAHLTAGGVRFLFERRGEEVSSGRTRGAYLAGYCSACEEPVLEVDLAQGVGLRIDGPGGATAIYCEACAPFEESSQVDVRPGDDLLAVGGGATETAGPFVLHEVLGAGGMSTVYRARDLVAGCWVALKLLSSGERHEQLLHRFHREAHILRGLEHPGLTRIVAMGAVLGRPYVAFEYDVTGRTLHDLAAERGWLDAPRAIAYVVQACEALAYVHERGVVHRDVKPGNLLVVATPEGERVRVIDFGLAHADLESSRSACPTRLGDVLGTIYYQAPEQIGDPAAADARSDVYSLGVTLYQLLCGRLPFPGAGRLPFADAVRLVRSGRPEPLSRHRPDLGRQFEELLARTMSRDPRARPANMTELARALRALT